MSHALETTPAGARVYISDYTAGAGADLSQWQLLGEAPVKINQIPVWGYYRIRATKAGFAPTDLVFVRHHFAVPEHCGTLYVDDEMHKSDESNAKLWTLYELNAFEKVEKCVSLQCAGNRRYAQAACRCDL